MDEQDVRTRAEAVCVALVAGDVGVFIESLSNELRQNVGEVLTLLPLPATEATIESIASGGSAAQTVVLRILGEHKEVTIQTRWKDRDGTPTIIEAGNLTSAARAAAAGEEAPSDEDEGGEADAGGGGASAGGEASAGS